jgi:hypothetical protein
VQTLSLPEDLRQEYLHALGIDSYFPRVRLPGAPESTACEWPRSWLEAFPPGDDKGEGSGLKTLQPDSTAPLALRSTEKAVNPASPSLGDSQHPGQTPEASAVKPETTHHTGVTKEAEESSRLKTVRPRAEQEEIRLQLLCVRINPDLAMLNVMPHLGPQHLAQVHRNLLAGMLRSMSSSHEHMQVDDKPFRWPMVQGGHVDNSRAAAAIALKAFLEQKQADWQFKSLLVMGENAVQSLFLSAAEEDGETSSNRSTLETGQWQTIYCRSLDEYLQNPQLKKEVWSLLRKLSV